MANKISIFGKKKFNDFEELELNRLLSDSAPFDVREAYLKLCTNISFIPSEKNCKTIAKVFVAPINTSSAYRPYPTKASSYLIVMEAALLGIKPMRLFLRKPVLISN